MNLYAMRENCRPTSGTTGTDVLCVANCKMLNDFAIRPGTCSGLTMPAIFANHLRVVEKPPVKEKLNRAHPQCQFDGRT